MVRIPMVRRQVAGYSFENVYMCFAPDNWLHNGGQDLEFTVMFSTLCVRWHGIELALVAQVATACY